MKSSHIFLLGRLFPAMLWLWLGFVHRGLALNFDPSGNTLSYNTPGNRAPQILRPPSDVLSQPGQSASFSVAASGFPLQYQWFFNASPLPQNTNDTLRIPNLLPAQFGSYYVVVSNGQGTVTSAVARIELDLDRDGLPDSWETTFFGSITNQNAAMDADKDGVPNRDEYRDGTNPSSISSLRPRLELFSNAGRILVAPDVESYSTNDVITLTAELPAGMELSCWSGDLSGRTNPATLNMSRNRAVQATVGFPLTQALGVTNRVTSGGLGGWFGQSAVTHDGQLAASTAPALVPAPLNSVSWMESEVRFAKDGLVGFWWKVDANSANRLALLVDGRLDFLDTRTLPGRTGWVPKTFFLKAGTHSIRWQYSRTSDSYYTPENRLTAPADAAWVDQLQWFDGYDPAIDSDGNGLSDLAEYQYFDRLGNDPTGDPDFDYVPTWAELFDGTNPTDPGSVNPRVTYLVEGRGAATTSPSQLVYTRNQSVTHTAVPDSGWSFYAWVGPFQSSFGSLKVVTNNPAADTLPVGKTYRSIFALPLAATLESGSLTWSTGGVMPWYGQTQQSFRNGNAARSGPTLKGDEESWLETLVNGPGTLDFWWQVSSATNRDHLILRINESEISRISGIQDWTPVSRLLGPGTHRVRWTFKRNFGFDTNVANSAWVDAVRFAPGSTPPTVQLLSQGGTLYQGTDVSMAVQSTGTPPLQYQLFRNGQPFGNLSSQTTLWISNIAPAQAGSWQVAAYNAVGTNLSSPIVFQVLPVPPVNDQFSAATILSGPLPLSIQGYTRGATSEAGELEHSDNNPLRSVWYRWTAPTSGKVQLSLVSTNAENGLVAAVHRGLSVSSLTEIADDEDYGHDENGMEVVRIKLLFDAVAGTPYYFVVDSTFGEGDRFELLLESVPPPANDAFANRIPVTGTLLSLSGDNLSATREAGEPNLGGLFFNIASNSVWWEWTAPGSGKVEIKATGDNWLPVVTVYRPGSVLASLTEVGNSLFSATQSVQFDADAGQSYPISVRTAEKAGEFTMTIAMETASMTAELRSTDGKLVISVRGPTGRNIQLEASADLKAWTAVSSGVIPPSGILTIVSPPGSTRERYLFYRAQLQ